MRIGSKRNRRAAGAMIGAAIASLGANSASGATPASWLNPADGTWNIAANWSTPSFPNNGSPGAADTYDAIIGATGAAYVVTLNSSITVNTFTLNAASVTLDQSSGVLSATGGIAIQAGVFRLGGAIVGGTVSTSGGGTLFANGGVLDGVTLDGDVQIGQQQQATLYINHDSAINGTVLVGNPGNANNGNLFFGGSVVANQTLSGTANILLGANNNNTLYNYNQGTLTLSPGITIHGQKGSIVNVYGSSGQIINQGTISADVAGGLIAIGNNNGTFSSTGTLETKNGSTLTLSGPWSSSGIITVNNSTLNLGGAFTTAGIGTINRTGGTINITGTLDNSATGPLNINASSGSWTLQGGILGGTVNTTGGSTIIGGGGTLDGVTLNGEVDVGQQQQASLYFNHDSTINGTVLVGNPANGSNGNVFFGATAVANQTISGTANLLLGGSTNNTLYNYNQGTLTLGSGVTIHGQNGSVVNLYPGGKIINQGTISADVAGGLIAIDNGNGTFSNTGTLQTKNGSTLTVGGAWSNSGIITVNNSTLNLGGNFTTAGIGTINRTGGTVNITGTLDNTATGPLNFNATSGSWNLQSGGGILGGTVNTTGGSTVIAAGGALDGVTLNGEVDVGQQQPSSLFINHDSTINGTVLVGNPTIAYVGAVYFGASAATNQTIFGTANILLGSTNNVLYNYNQGMLTLGPGVTIHGQNGSLIDIFASGQIVNQGTISADVAGGVIAVGSGNGLFSNTGTLAARNGAALTVYSPTLTNLSGNTLTGGHYYTFAGSTIDFGGAAITTNAADIRLDGLGSRFDAINSLATNNGTFTVANGRTFNITPTTFVNNGALNAAAGGTIVIPGPTNSTAGGTNNGTINCSTGGTIIFNGSFLHAANSFLNGAGSVIFNGGTQTFNGTLIGDFDLTIAGAANFGPLSKTTTKTLDIQSGNTLVAAGAQLNIGTTTLPGQVTFSGTTSPTIALTAGSTAASLVLGNSNISVANTGGIAQILTAGSGAQDGQFDLGGQTRTITFNANRTLLVTAQVIHGGIITSGAGILELSNSNTYAGGSTITTGTLQVTDLNALGPGSVSFSDGTLDVRSDMGTATLPNPLFATGPTHSMFLHVAPVATASTNTYVFGSTTLGGNLTIAGTGTAQLGVATLTHDLTVDNFIPLNITGPIAGTGGLTRDSSTGATGTLTMSGNSTNTYTGTTIINGGALVLNKSAGVTAIPHDLQILGGTVQSLASDQIADTSIVTLQNSNSVWDCGAFNETVGGLTVSGGTLTGSGKVTVLGTFTWTGGMMTGSGTTAIGSAAVGSIPRSGTSVTLGHELHNDGAITQTATVYLGGVPGGAVGIINNAADGTYHILGEQGSVTSIFQDAGHQFNNFGTLLIGGDGNGADFHVPLTSSGSININAGVLNIWGGATSSGNIYLAPISPTLGNSYLVIYSAFSLTGGNLDGPGNVVVETGAFNWYDGTITGSGDTTIGSNATFYITGGPKSTARTIDLGGGMYGDADLTILGSLFCEGGTMAGPGATIIASGGTLSLQFGSLTSARTISLSGNLISNNDLTETGTFNWIDGTMTGTGKLAIGTTGTLNVSLPSKTTGMKLELSGTLSGNGDLTETGVFNWLGGTMNGSGALIIPPSGAFNISTSAAKSLNRTIQNAGAVLWSDGNISCNSPSAFNNSGNFIATSDSTITYSATAGSNNSFNNSVTGMLTKLGAGTVVFANSSGLSFTNAGTVIVFSGTLAFGTPPTNTGSISTTNQGVLRMGPFAGAFANAGTIDISGGGAVIDYSSSTPFVTIQSQLKTGFANGAWNGVGINSFAAAANVGLHRTAIGFAEASALGITSTGSFLGGTVDSTSVLLRYTYSGDADLDGTVSSSDFDRLAANFGAAGKFWIDGDYNYDGIVNALDFNALATNYGQVIGSSADLRDAQPAVLPGIGVMVPEPVGATILAGSCWLFGRRRRCCRMDH